MCIIVATTQAHNIHMQQVALSTHVEKQQQKTPTPSQLYGRASPMMSAAAPPALIQIMATTVLCDHYV
jgi:hypothetical protein